jgi:hypothetical protein
MLLKLLTLPKLVLNINAGEDGMLEDQGKDGNMKNTLGFKGTGFQT